MPVSQKIGDIDLVISMLTKFSVGIFSVGLGMWSITSDVEEIHKAVNTRRVKIMQEPKIIKNPKTGKKEHDKAKWIDWEILISQGSPKISAAAQWAKRKISENNLL